MTILTADLKSTWKTDYWNSFGVTVKIHFKDVKKGKFNDLIYKLKEKVSFANFIAIFEHLLVGILKKGKHFQLSVFSADSKSAVKIKIWALWNFGFPIGVGKM